MATEDRLACKLYVLTDYGTCVLLLYNPDQEIDNKNNTKKIKIRFNSSCKQQYFLT